MGKKSVKKNNGVKEFFGAANEVRIKLTEFSNLNFIEKNEKIRDAIKNTTGFRDNITSGEILKILNFIDDQDSTETFINKELLILRDKEEIVIRYRKGKIYMNVIIFVATIVLITCIGTFIYLFRERLLSVNLDINGDGIPELNIDVDGDGVADVNIDEDDDNKPDYNINYRKHGVAVFNIKNDNKYKNLINQDVNNDNVCDINCDINDDGWPDVNIDLDGDMVADLFIDSERRGYATLNLDINGDKICDINCDTDDDNKCDVNCLDFEVIKYINITNGLAGININTPVPTIQLDGNVISCSNLFPTDQPDENVLKECKATFVVKNTSSIKVAYNLRLMVGENSFVSENLKYKLLSNNGISNITHYVSVPQQNKTVLKNITLEPRASHTYSVSIILEGTNDEQHYDTGRNLSLKFEIDT